MLYTVNTDNELYVLSISHTSNDNIELDLSLIDLKYLNAYKLIDNELILDQEKKQKLVEDEIIYNKTSRINELKILLNETDYICARAFEEVLALSNPLTFISDFIKILVKYSTEYKEVIANRIAWRKEIQELEK